MQSQQAFPFTELPLELQFFILTFLDPEYIVRVASTNKTLRQKISGEKALLKYTFAKYFPHIHKTILKREEIGLDSFNYFLILCKTLGHLPRDIRNAFAKVRDSDISIIESKFKNEDGHLQPLFYKSFFDYRDGLGRTLLDYMILTNNPSFTKTFYEKYISLYKDGDYPAYVPILFNQPLEVIKAKFKRSEDFNQSAFADIFNANKPLHFAAMYCPQSIPYLIANNADINQFNRYSQRPLELAVQKKNEQSVDALLLDPRIEITEKIFQIAVKNNSFMIFQKLLARKTLAEKELVHLLYLAAEFGATDVVEDIVSKIKSNLTQCCESAMKIAIQHEKIEIINFFYSHPTLSAQLQNTRYFNNNTALHCAAYGHVKATKFFLVKGADVNAVNENGDTSLHIAARNNQTEIVQLLLQQPHRKILTNKEGKKPYQVAGKNTKKQLEIIKYIEDREIKIERNILKDKKPLSKKKLEKNAKKLQENKKKLELANLIKVSFFGSNDVREQPQENLDKQVQISKKLTKILLNLRKF